MFMLVLVSTIASARTRQDVIYLKNGEVVRGEIIGHEYQGFNTLVQIRTEDGKVLTFQMDEVEMISNGEEKGGKKGGKDEDFVSAQFGLRAGMNVSTLGGDDADFNSRVGFHVGMIVDVPLCKDNFYFQPGLYFTLKGFKDEGVNENKNGSVAWNGRSDMYYLEVPLLFSGRYTFGIAQLQVSFGPYIGLGVMNRYKYEDDYDTRTYAGIHYWDEEMLDVGLSMGAGVLLKNHYYIGFQYDLGLKKTDDYYGATGWDCKSGKPRSWMIGIGYNF